MSTALDQAHDQALTQLESIREMVTALDVDYDRLEELRDWKKRADECRGADGKFEDVAEEEHYDQVVDALTELEREAGDCESREDAEQRISEDALEIQVRSGWYNPGEDSTPEEFFILLCTGGPAVRIMGELDEHLEPKRAWLEYQNWGTSWTELVLTPGEGTQDVLLTYARQFYYGG